MDRRAPEAAATLSISEEVDELLCVAEWFAAEEPLEVGFELWTALLALIVEARRQPELGGHARTCDGERLRMAGMQLVVELRKLGEAACHLPLGDDVSG